MSILKVNTIQDKGGNTIISSDGSGTFTPYGFGKIGQVVSATDTTIRTSTSTSFTDASNTCSLTITPSSTSSKILLVCSFSGGLNTADKRASYTWFRDSTNLGDATEGLRSYEIQGTGNYSIESNMTVDWIDSPNTTSSITYTLQFKAETGTVYFNNRGYAQSYAMEILA